jgi:hypothetical protein
MLENFRGLRKFERISYRHTRVFRANNILHRVSGKPLRQIPLFPPLLKGDERGIFFVAFASEIFRIFWMRLCSARLSATFVVQSLFFSVINCL